MTHGPPWRVAALAALTATLAAAGCGGGEAIPADRSQALLAELGQVSPRVREGECERLERGTLRRLERQVAALPADTDEQVRARLDEGLDRLSSLVARDCEEKPDPEPTPTAPVVPAPVAPAPAPQQEAPEEEKPEEEKEKPEKDGDDGGGRDGGGGGRGRDGGGGGDPCPPGAPPEC
jgi:hypothetical protein